MGYNFFLNQQLAQTNTYTVYNTHTHIYIYIYMCIGKAIPVQTWTRPWGFQEAKAPRFLSNWHTKVVRLSVLRTGRLYPAGNIPGTHFFYGLSRPQGHSVAGRIKSWKIPMTLSGIEPATCRLVAQCLNQLPLINVRQSNLFMYIMMIIYLVIWIFFDSL
jgi:hypothetical protein